MLEEAEECITCRVIHFSCYFLLGKMPENSKKERKRTL